MKCANESFNLKSALSLDSLPGEMLDLSVLMFSCMMLLLAAKSILKELSTVMLRRAPLVDTRPKAGESDEKPQSSWKIICQGSLLESQRQAGA